ncbi:MAG: hypothetical protein ACHQ5A_11840 [Opitutales bacterium]
MFIGHFAVGFAAKRAAPEVKLWQALLAAGFLDVIWPVLILSGAEQVIIEPGNTPMTPFNFVSYPWSHSLAMAVLWGVLFGAVYKWRSGTRRGAIWLGVLVVSHWVLDFVSHRPDMPIVPGVDLKLGLGLWYSVPATVLVEVSMFAIGLALYVADTRAKDRQGSISLTVLAGILLVAYGVNLAAPPPPSVAAVGIGGLAGMALTLLLALWVDRHRVNTARQSRVSARSN